jgi:hypothetical protein
MAGLSIPRVNQLHSVDAGPSMASQTISAITTSPYPIGHPFGRIAPPSK